MNIDEMSDEELAQAVKRQVDGLNRLLYVAAERRMTTIVDGDSVQSADGVEHVVLSVRVMREI